MFRVRCAYSAQSLQVSAARTIRHSDGHQVRGGESRQIKTGLCLRAVLLQLLPNLLVGKMWEPLLHRLEEAIHSRDELLGRLVPENRPEGRLLLVVSLVHHVSLPSMRLSAQQRDHRAS